MEQQIGFLTELRTAAGRRGIKLNDLFWEYDRKNTGKVPLTTFQKVLSSINFMTTEQRVKSVIADFIHGNQVNYADFFSLLETSTPQASASEVTDEDVRQFGSDLQIKGSDVISVMVPDFDPHRLGRVSTEVFLRAFGNTPLTQKIVKRYQLPTVGQIDYNQLSKDIDKFVKKVPQPQQQAPPKATSLPPFFSNVASVIKVQGIDPISLFSRFDKFKHQTVSRQTFITQLGNIGLPVNPAQLDQLVDYFADGNQVNYALFNDEIQKAIDDMPVKNVKKQSVDLNSTIVYIQGEIEKRHADLAPQFQSFDSKHNGLISNNHFFNTLTQSACRISNIESNAISEQFGDGNGNINYQDFLEAVTPRSTRSSVSGSDVIARLKSHLSQHSIQLKPKLDKYDREGKGTIPMNDFLAVLRMISFDMTPRETAVLKSEFGNQRVSIDQLCREVDPAPKKMKEPTPEPNEYARPPRQNSEIPEDVEDALVKLIVVEKKAHIDFFTEFKQNDHLRHGVIPTSQFEATLLGCVIPISPADVKLLTSFYSSGTTVNYADLCQDMLNLNAIMNDQEEEPVDQRSTSEETMNVIKRLKNYLSEQRISVEDFFSRYDSNRQGCVLKSKLRQIFDAARFQLTTDEESSLKHDFEHDTRAEMLDYTKIMTVLQSIQLTQADLRSIKCAPANARVQDQDIAVLNNSIRERLDARHKKIRLLFKGCSEEGIDQREFREVLNSFGIMLREFEIQKIVKKYRCNKQGDIDWLSFVEDVESGRTIQQA